MKKAFKFLICILLFLGINAGILLLVTTDQISILNPKGMIGLEERNLIMTSSLLMLIVVIPVFILTLAFAWRFRKENEKARHTPDWEHNHIAECCWWGVPLAIIVVLGVITYRSSHMLDPFREIKSDAKPVQIQVVALTWKWLFLYPEEGIATLNYVQFPEKTPISFEITADAPMNSFWIPRLGGQVYAMTGMRSELHLIANEQGSFNGSSANFSGKGFEGMRFIAQATSPAAFKEWAQSVKKSAAPLSLETYEKLVEPSQNVEPTVFVLKERNLFDAVIMKYMTHH